MGYYCENPNRGLEILVCKVNLLYILKRAIWKYEREFIQSTLGNYSKIPN